MSDNINEDDILTFAAAGSQQIIGLITLGWKVSWNNAEEID